MRTEINKEIEAVSKTADPLKILASADTMKVLGVQRPVLQVRHLQKLVFLHQLVAVNRTQTLVTLLVKFPHMQTHNMCSTATCGQLGSLSKHTACLFDTILLLYPCSVEEGSLEYTHLAVFLWSLLVQGHADIHTCTLFHPFCFSLFSTLPPISQDHNCDWNSAWSFLSV